MIVLSFWDHCYLVDSLYHSIRCFGPEGILSTVAGTGQSQGVDENGDGGLAADVCLQVPRAIALSPDSNLHLCESNGAVHSVSSQLPPGNLHGSERITRIDVDGTETTTLADGTVVSIRGGPDPQSGMQAPLAAELTVTVPSGLTVESSHRLQVIEAPVTRSLLSRTNTIEYHGSGLERGLVRTTTDPTEQRVSWDYDLMAHVVQQTMPGERAIRTRFDGVGNLLELTPPGRPAHSWLYTSLDLPQTYRPPEVAGIANPETSFTYNLDQQPESLTRADSQRINYHYLADGRLSAILTTNGRHEYGYDPSSRLLQSITAPGGNQLVYENDGALLTAQSWHGAFVNGTVGYQYNNLLWLDRLSIAGTDIDYDHDRDGLLVQAGALTLDRDPLSGFVTGTSFGIVTDRWLLTSFAELAEYEASVAGESVYAYSVATDKLGRIRQLTETIDGRVTVYDYDYTPAGQLASVHNNSAEIALYSYDANGNRTHIGGIEVATFDAQDRIESHATDDGNCVYSHNDHGEVVRKQEFSSGRMTEYDRDAFGNLRRVGLPDGTVIDYIIDGQHRRIGKVVDGAFAQGVLYQDQLNPVAELDGAGNVIARFVYGTRANVPAYIIKDDTTYRIISDYRGSPRLVIHSETGAIAQRIDYDIWGHIVADTNPGFQPFGFAGGIYDRDTGLVHLGAREYDPHIGRWLSKDPAGFGGGDTNLYAYAGSDPVNYIDPNGEVALLAPLLWGVFVQAAGGAAMDAAIDLGEQLLDSGGDIGCVNWGSVGGSALSGAAQGAAGGALGNLAKVARVARAAMGRGRKFTGPEKTDGGYWVQVDAKTLRPIMKKKRSGLSGKEAASDAPSWAKGQTPYAGENGDAFATRLLDEKYGVGNWTKGSGTEHNQLQKWGDRAFIDPE